jgi:hypothetical protein
MPSTLPSRSFEPGLRSTVAAICALVILTAIIYWPVRQFGFVNYDDPVYVLHNKYVQAGFSRDTLHYAFTANFGGWSPLVWLSYVIDRQFFAAAPAAIHVENVFWHALGGILLWVLLSKLTAAAWRSWIVAALFLCHPMHVESVAWISERKDVLSIPLLLAAMLAYWRYCNLPNGWRRSTMYCLILLLFVLSLMAKAMGVTLPLLLILLDYWPLRRIQLSNLTTVIRMVIEKLPVLAVTVIFSIVSLETQQAGGATAAGASVPLFDRFGNAIVCYMIYVSKLVIPTKLAAFYVHPGARPMPAIVAAAGLLFLISWLVIRYRDKAPYLVTGWFWFVIALLPVIGIVQIGGQAMADRYSYLPSIGFFIAVVWGIDDLLTRVQPMTTSILPQICRVLFVVVPLTILSILAHRQVRYWKNTETLFTHSCDVTGPNPVACYALGTAEFARGDLQAALRNFTSVVIEDPGNDKAVKYLGDIFIRFNLAKAIEYYQQAVLINPGKIDYRIALAASLTQQGDRASLVLAAEQLRAVLQIDPSNPQAHAGLADVQSRLKAKQSNR